MSLEVNQHENYVYEKLTEEEIKSRGILGRLVGNVADFVNPTRNGRKYSEELWEQVFDNPIMKEKFANKVMYGELGHPADRTEIDPEKIAVCMSEPPKKCEDGTLKAVFDILPTPNGRILKALCDYGSTLGVSSRGTGEIITDDEGKEMVDPDTYDCECWDIVLVPAVESARLKYVNESVDKNKSELKMALCESLNSAKPEEREVMENTLHELNIDIKDTETKLNEDVNLNTSKTTIVEEVEDKSVEEDSTKQTIDESIEANNDGSTELVKSLQEALKEKFEAEAKVKSLQEQLAVSDTKVIKLQEEVGKYKSSTARLSTIAEDTKTLSEKISTLEESLKEKDKTISSQSERINKLVEAKKSELSETKSLNESISKKDNEIKILNENFDEIKNGLEGKIKTLTEEYDALKESSESKDKELAKEKKLKESYKKIANDTVSYYMEAKATMLGVPVKEIRDRLPDSYTIEDVETICEDLQSFELNMNKLPFPINSKKVKVKVHESVNESLRVDNGVDDDVDEQLFRLAKLDN